MESFFKSVRWPAIRIAVIYALLGGSWIILSDRALLLFTQDEEFLTRIQTFKGWFYVIITAYLIFHLIYIHLVKRHRAEIALKDSEEKLKVIFDQAFQFIYLLDLNGILLDVNKSLLDFTKVSKENIIGIPLLDAPLWVYKEEEKRKILYAIREAAKGNFRRMETEIITLEGEKRTFDISIQLIHSERERKSFLLAEWRDITQRKRTEANLRISEERYRSFFQNSAFGIFQTAVDGTILAANPAILKILAVDSLEELISNYNVADFYVEPSERMKIIASLVENGPVHTVETKIRKGNLTIAFVRVFIRLLRNESGERIIEGAMEDITEKRLAEEAMIEAKTKAENSDRLKTEFLAQMSHEIRTPINVILSFTQLLRDDLQGAIADELSESFEIIDRAGKRIIRTIDLLLNMSQLQTGTYDLRFEDFDIYEAVIFNLYAEYKSLADEKGIKLVINREESIPEIHADHYTVVQIFQNLIDNAIKYTNGGEVVINISFVGKSVIVSVTDSGIGISEEYLENIFEPFTQEEQGYTRKFEGNGLGLALVKKYCDLNRAKINVVSEKNVGSTFTVTFI